MQEIDYLKELENVEELSGEFQEIQSEIKNLIVTKCKTEDISKPVIQIKKEEESVQEEKKKVNKEISQIQIKQQEIDADLQHSKNSQISGFIKWAEWVPMPYPHRELMAAKRSYIRGDNLLVQTPDFLDFANDVKNHTSRHALIYQVKRMMLQRGIRAILQMSYTGELKNLNVIVNCYKSGKSNCKNPSIKNQCPFVMYFQRKSSLIEEMKGTLRRRKKECFNMPTKLEDLDDFVFRDQEERRSKSGRPEGQNKFSQLLEDIDIPEDPFYLVRYRSFHNHPLCTNTIEYESLILDQYLHRKGAVRILPQGQVAIQELSAQRRQEVIDEGNLNRMQIKFEQVGKSTSIYTLEGIPDNEAQIRIIEPLGMEPQLIVVDQTQFSDEDLIPKFSLQQKVRKEQLWPPKQSLINHNRELVIKCYRSIISQVSYKLQQGQYTLEKWRRILKNMKAKTYQKTQQQIEREQQHMLQKRRKLNSKGNSLLKIVNQFGKENKVKKEKQDELVNSDEELQIFKAAEESTYNIYQ